MKHAVESASECETAILFFNYQSTIVIRIEAKQLGNTQLSTPVRVDNTSAHDYVHCNLQKKK